MPGSGNSRERVAKEDFVTAMRRSGSRTLTLERLEADIAAGAPVNADGTLDILKCRALNFYRYAAWLIDKRNSAPRTAPGGYVLSPSAFDPYEPGGVMSAIAVNQRTSRTFVNTLPK